MRLLLLLLLLLLFFFKTGFHHIEFPTSGDPPVLASNVLGLLA